MLFGRGSGCFVTFSIITPTFFTNYFKPKNFNTMAKTIKRKSTGRKKKPYVQQDSHGALFKNTEKETDSHPDYKGTYTDENGEKFWVAAWINESKSGKKYISFVTSSMEVEEDEEEEEEEETFNN